MKKTIIKCDLCNSIIKDNKNIHYYSKYFDKYIDVCYYCIQKRIDHSLNCCEEL